MNASTDGTDSNSYFEEHGYYPTIEIAPRIKRAKGLQSTVPRGGAQSSGTRMQSWRQVPHWNVPPAFANSGFALSELGLQEYLRAVKEYYESIGNVKVEHQKVLYERWVIRACLSTFKTQVMGCRRQEVSARKNIGKGGGGIFLTSSEIPQLPEDLASPDGRFLADLKTHFENYGVRKESWPAVERWFRAKLERTWGITCS